jgi:hypothetical protein
MWIKVFWSVLILLVVTFVWRFVSDVWAPRQPIEPADDASVLGHLRPRPTLNSGAVALEEPDDELA